VIDLSVRHLQAFVAVADELHFGRAAERLGIAQSALSQRIRRLEDAVNAQLLVRTSRRVALTPAGEVLRDGARRVLADLERVVGATHGASAGEIGTIAIGAQGAALNHLVPAVVAALAERAPGVRVELSQLTSEEQAVAIAAGAVDVGFIREADPRPGLTLEPVHEEPVCAVVPSSHPRAREPELSLGDLAHEPFVLWRRAGAPGFFDDLTTACRRAGFTPHIAYEIRGIQARLGLVAAGLGVSLEAASYASTSHSGVRFVPLAGDPVKARIQLAWNPQRFDPKRDLVLDVARRSRTRSTAS
jgi:DNA-binding transcriptional LysR family regulator